MDIHRDRALPSNFTHSPACGDGGNRTRVLILTSNQRYHSSPPSPLRRPNLRRRTALAGLSPLCPSKFGGRSDGGTVILSSPSRGGSPPLCRRPRTCNSRCAALRREHRRERNCGASSCARRQGIGGCSLLISCVCDTRPSGRRGHVIRPRNEGAPVAALLVLGLDLPHRAGPA